MYQYKLNVLMIKNKNVDKTIKKKIKVENLIQNTFECKQIRLFRKPICFGISKVSL